MRIRIVWDVKQSLINAKLLSKGKIKSINQGYTNIER